MSVLARELELAERVQTFGVTGRVSALRGLTVLVDHLPLPVGAVVRLGTRRAGEPGAGEGEVVGFEGARALVMPLGSTVGLRAGDPVVGLTNEASVRVGERSLGRVINAFGVPIDGGGAIHDTSVQPLNPPPLAPMRRRRIVSPISTGVRALDGMLTVGLGQRLGVFAGPGVGKSTLMGTIARHSSAGVNVIALIGERGREVRDFIEDSLGPEGLARSVVVVATSDESPLLRLRALSAASAVAEYFRDLGEDVLLMADSVTRYAQAQRQVGLAAGEPPATKGYTPSVFAMLPRILERAGAVEGGGSITGFYTVLVEGDDMTEPIADAVRGVLDGHIVLSRSLARRGHYPAIDVLDSISRLADGLCDAGHVAARRRVLKLLAAHAEISDLLQIGAYAKGSNPEADLAIDLKADLDAYLQQGQEEDTTFDQAKGRLLELALRAGDRRPAGAAARSDARGRG